MIQTNTIIIVVLALIALGIYVIKKATAETKREYIFAALCGFILLGFCAAMSFPKRDTTTQAQSSESPTIIYLPNNQFIVL